MKGLVKSVSIACVFAACAAHATDGTVRFTGEIVDSPCVVSADSLSQEVNLGQVKTSVFSAKGDRSPEKPFEIKLEECDVSKYKTAHVSFTGNESDADNTLLSINNEAGSATGVGIGIYDKTGEMIDMNTGEASDDLKEGETVLYYSASYVQESDNAVTAGLGNSQVDFNITYE
ncbi:long polar fimbrial protein LpfA [Enterobacteriaceae bacterium 89]|nr:long polar fimbrial protein LpfA [Enterobacteriaceae bacterium 89]